MNQPGSNGFGPNFPRHFSEAALEVLGISSKDRVLDVGGGGQPFPRADVVVDESFSSSLQRNGTPAAFLEGVTWVEAPAERLPFADREFDFVWCSHTLEHVRDPEAVCHELSRVARRGFVEVPSRFGELLNGNPSHRWIIDLDGGDLVFTPRPFLAHPLKNLFYGVIFNDPALRRVAEEDFRNLFNHQVIFEGRLGCRVVRRFAGAFNYDDPAQAASAHYSFARNGLRSGVDPAFVLPDALAALHLRPEAADARQLLESCRNRLRVPWAPGGTRSVLVAPGSLDVRLGHPAADAFGRALEAGLPAAEVLDPAGACGALVRPAISVIVLGSDATAIRGAVESALTQADADVQVVVASAGGVAQALSDLRLAERLVVLESAPHESHSYRLGRMLRSCRHGLVGFLRDSDRLLPHHAATLAGRLFASSCTAVRGLRVFSKDDQVWVELFEAGEPDAGAISTLLVLRSAISLAMDTAGQANLEPPMAWIPPEILRRPDLETVPAVTVICRQAPASVPSRLLDAATASSMVDVWSVGQALHASHARVAALFRKLGSLPAGGHR